MNGLRIVSFVLLLWLPAQAFASEGDFYFGFSIGRTFVDANLSSPTANIDDEETGYKIYVGRPLWDFLDLEFALVDLGQATLSGQALDFFKIGDTQHQFAGDGQLRTSMEALTISGIYTHKIFDKFWARGQAGLAFWSGDLDVTNSTFSGSTSESGVGAVLGGGVRWEFVDHLSVRADYEFYLVQNESLGIDGVNMLSAGLILSF